MVLKVGAEGAGVVNMIRWTQQCEKETCTSIRVVCPRKSRGGLRCEGRKPRPVSHSKHRDQAAPNTHLRSRREGRHLTRGARNEKHGRCRGHRPLEREMCEARYVEGWRWLGEGMGRETSGRVLRLADALVDEPRRPVCKK